MAFDDTVPERDPEVLGVAVEVEVMVADGLGEEDVVIDLLAVEDLVLVRVGDRVYVPVAVFVVVDVKEEDKVAALVKVAVFVGAEVRLGNADLLAEDDFVARAVTEELRVADKDGLFVLVGRGVRVIILVAEEVIVGFEL